MASSKRIPEPSSVPDPARSYERAKPHAESGMGRLDNNDDAVPTSREDSMPKAVKNAQQNRQINAEQGVVDARKTHDPNAPQPDRRGRRKSR